MSPIPGMHAPVQSLAFECSLDLETHSEVTEYGKSDGMSLPRFGYKEIVAFILGACPL